MSCCSRDLSERCREVTPSATRKTRRGAYHRQVGLRRAILLAGALLPAACSGDARPATPAGATTTTGATAAPAPAELPLARTEVASAVLDGRIVVAGGLTADGGASDRADVYDPVANRWESGPSLPLALHHSGMAALDGRFV